MSKDYTYRGFTFRVTSTTTSVHVQGPGGIWREELRYLYEIDGLKERGKRPFLTSVAQCREYIADHVGKREPGTIKRLRAAVGLTQDQLAVAAGVNVSLIRKLETGTVKAENVTLASAVKLADALGVEPSELLGGD